MVLNRSVLVFLLAAAGCGQSLFDGNGGGSSGDAAPSATCPATCLADAGGDFDGSPGGRTGRWRYLEDPGSRTWQVMTTSGATAIGSNPANVIASCAGDASAPACALLPGALLMSAADGAAPDPAIEFTADAAQVVSVTVRIAVPAGVADQPIRLYRGSREDLLWKGTATAGMVLEQELTLDALPGDRLLLALVSTAAGADRVGVQMFVSATGAAFPASCQLGLSFAASTINAVTVDNLCGADFTGNDDNGMWAPLTEAGPYAEQGTALALAPGQYLRGADVLSHDGDLTYQLWMRTDAVDPIYMGYALADYDLDVGGGLGIGVYDDNGALRLESGTCTSPDPLAFAVSTASWQNGGWHFVRVVHAEGKVTLCVDGARASSFDRAAGALVSTFPPYVGKNVRWLPAGAFYDGAIDDLRVFDGALPCD